MHSIRHFLVQKAGMTLVELLVAVGVTSVIMGISISIFLGQHKSYQKSHAVKESQSDVQKSLQFVKEELSLAGWSVLPQMAFFLQDGGAGSDKIYLNDINLINIDNDDEAQTRDELALMASSECGGCRTYRFGSPTASLDIDGDGRKDLTLNGGGGVPVIVYNYSRTFVCEKTADNTGNLVASRFIPPTPVIPIPTKAAVAPVIYYCVTNGELKRQQGGTQDAQALAEHVVDMQVRYRANGTTFGDSGCNATATCQMNPFDASAVEWIDLTLVTRSSERTQPTTKADSCRPAVLNHAGSNAAADCGYEYRVYTSRILPFNSVH